MTFRLRNTSDPMPKNVRLYSVGSLNNVENSKKTTSKSWELSLEDFLKKNPTLDEKYYNYLKDVVQTDATRAGYMSKMKYFIKWAEDLETTSDLSEMNDTKKIEDLLRKFLSHLKNERSSSGATQRQYVTSIIQFLSECRIKPDKSFVTRVISKHTPQKIQSWTRPEIQKMLKTSLGNKPKLRAMILLYASTGMRREGLVGLKFGDLKAVEDLYEVTVYAGEPEEYKTYCTPEAREALDEYLNTRRDGKEYTTNYPLEDGSTKRITKKLDPENIVKDSYVFTNDFKNNEKLGVGIVTNYFVKVQSKAGVDGQKNKHTIHSFRHTFQTALTNAVVIGQDGNEYPAIPTVRQRQLMGHKITTNDLQTLYTDDNQESLLREYQKVIPELTFCKETILEKENIDLREKLSQPEVQTSKEFEEFKTQMYAEKKEMLEQIAELTKAVKDLTVGNRYEEEVENSLVRSRKGSKTLVVSNDKSYLVY